MKAISLILGNEVKIKKGQPSKMAKMSTKNDENKMAKMNAKNEEDKMAADHERGTTYMVARRVGRWKGKR